MFITPQSGIQISSGGPKLGQIRASMLFDVFSRYADNVGFTVVVIELALCNTMTSVSYSRAVALSLGLTRGETEIHPTEPHLPIEADVFLGVLVIRVDSLANSAEQSR
jgi:hypothetical protein